MRLILTILLIGLMKAEGQMVINASAPYRPTAVVSEIESGFSAAYSLRKLRSSYSGSAIRVRKDTTGQPEQDIGFLGSGELDTISLKSFLNARSGFVVTWYNQGDSSSIDFAQSTAASQPRIANLGVIDRQNTKPCLVFDGSNDFMDVASSTNRFNYLHNGTDCFMASVQRFSNVSNPNASYAFINNANFQLTGIVGFNFFFDDRASVPRNNAIVISIGSNVCNNSAADFAIPNTQLLITQVIDANNTTFANRSILYANSSNEQKNNTMIQAPSLANAAHNMRLGRRSNATDFNLLGSVQEIIIWNSNKISQRTSIETNINTFYSIY